jgi:hypothetical protein
MPGLIGGFLGLAMVVAAAGVVLARSADGIAAATGLGRLLVVVGGLALVSRLS